MVQLGPIVITVPEGALEACVVLAVREEALHPAGNVGPAYRIDPPDVVIKKPLHLELHVGDESVPQPYLYEELKLGLASADGWSLLKGSTADTAAGTVSGAVARLGVWDVLPRVKIDLLWVTENGVGMARVENGLAVGFHRVSSQLKAASLRLRREVGHFFRLEVGRLRFQECFSEVFSAACFLRGWPGGVSSCGWRRDGPSMRMVMQRWRMRESRAAVRCLFPRRPFQSS